MKLPQRRQELYDCINDQKQALRPPDLEVENFSKYREK